MPARPAESCRAVFVLSTRRSMLMTEIAERVTASEPCVLNPAVLALVVENLRKEFVRRDGKAGRRRSAACSGARRRQLHHGARRVRRDPRPERVGQVDAGPPALDAAPARRRQRERLRARRLPRQRRRARLVNRVSVEASFFKRMSAAENLSLRGPLLRDDARTRRAHEIPEILGGSGSRPTAAASRWRTSRAACSRRSRSRGRS